ncbi:MAG: YceG family protein, partial [Niallia sp.]
LLDPEKIMNAHYWNYKQIPVGLQRGIASAISRVCARPALKKHSNETDEDVAIFLFSQCLLIHDDFLKMLQKFDYAQAVPSIILFKTEQNGVFTREDAAMLLLMNTIGVDIIIYNPAGHVDMETFTKETLFDIHWLEDVVFDMEYKEPSFLKRGIFSGFLKNRKGE